MGAIVSCCKIDNKGENKTETNEYYLNPLQKLKKKNNFKNDPFFDINNVIITEESSHTKNNDNNNDNDHYDIEKIKKIQRKYRSYLIHNKFVKEIKPSIENKTTKYLNDIYKHCSLGKQIPEIEDDFSEDGWRRYYPSNERFFLYQKGDVFSNQIRLKNIDDPENIEIYEGETNFDNLKHGFGVLTNPHYILKGSWRKGEFTGWGRKLYRNGDVLEGKFINGEINGKGIYKNKDSLYIGEFINGERCGKGDLTTQNYHYKGDFKRNNFNGFGVIEFLIEEHRYEGNFENNEINGKGIYKWKNGDIYEGEMKCGKMNGFGKYTYNDGKIYEGEYVNGIKSGKGKLSYPNGNSFNGYFKDGLPDGEGIYSKDEIIYKVLFSQGVFVKVLS